MADTYSTLEHMGSRLIAATPNMFVFKGLMGIPWEYGDLNEH